MIKKAKWSLAAAAAVAVCLGLSLPASAEEGGLDTELEQFWSADRDVRVIENRLFEREGRFGAGLYTGLLSSDPFFYYFPVGVRATYHFSNSLGVEVGGAFMDAPFLTHNTELTDFLQESRRESFNSATDTMDRYLWRANAVAVWSPFYGKLAILQRKLAHFDLNVAGGLGMVQVERPGLDTAGQPSLSGEAFNHITMEVVTGVGAHFYITDSLLVRLDGRGYLYRGAELVHNTDSFFRQLKFPMEFLVGATYLF